MDIESVSSTYIPPPAPETAAPVSAPPPLEEIPVSDTNIVQSTIDIIA
ncbi:MAG: hypothetical protein JXB50_01385 [Spirochaetes bacterium]|nr:hypothetical protein [Spirochaetota bacterium]